MRKKELKLVITFHTTTDAMAMEQMCKEMNISGRLIPVPRTLSAGCGLAWKAELDERELLLEAMKKVNLEMDDFHECMV